MPFDWVDGPLSDIVAAVTASERLSQEAALQQTAVEAGWSHDAAAGISLDENFRPSVVDDSYEFGDLDNPPRAVLRTHPGYRQ